MNIFWVLISLFPGPLKKIAYRLKGCRIGSKVKIGFFCILNVGKGSYIDNGSRLGGCTYIKVGKLYMESYARIAPFSYIKAPMVKLGRDSFISNFVTIRSGHVSKRSELLVGDLVHVFPFVNLDCSRKIEIRREAAIGPKSDVYTHSAYKSVLDGYKVVYGDVVIGERAELSYNIFVSPGVTIGADAICACGSFINTDIPEGVLAAGQPAVVKRTKEQITKPIVENNTTLLLTEIIAKYREDISLVTGRNPLEVFICDSGMNDFSREGVIYLCNFTALDYGKVRNSAILDIPHGVCINRGINQKDFAAFRKYLSRYGIRFITQD